MKISTKIITWLMILAIAFGALYFWQRNMVEVPANRTGDITEEERDEVVQNSLLEVRGVILNIFAGADNFILESESGQEWNISVDSFTQTFDEEGSLIEGDDFPMTLEPGTSVLAIIDAGDDNTGTALLIRILSGQSADGEFFKPKGRLVQVNF